MEQPDGTVAATGEDRPVLVVDDDPAIVETVTDMLAFAGRAVVAASNGAEALARLDAGLDPGAILLDMRMPVLDGWGFAASMKDRGRTLRNVVVMTAATDARAWAEEIGAAGCLPKPFDMDDLLATANRLCGDRGLDHRPPPRRGSIRAA